MTPAGWEWILGPHKIRIPKVCPVCKGVHRRIVNETFRERLRRWSYEGAFP